MDDDAYRHRFCVSVAFNRREYARSPGYAICDQDGAPNPNGTWVHTPKGKLKEIAGHCDHPNESCLAHRIKDPDTEVIPLPSMETVVEPEPQIDPLLERLDKLIALHRGTANT